MSWVLQKSVYTFDLPLYNPFVGIFESPTYDFLDIIQKIVKIYKQQSKGKNTVQSSDFHLQFLRNDLHGKWTNRDILFNSNTNSTPIQQVMLIDLFPSIYNTEKDRLKREMETTETRKTYDMLWSKSKSDNK